MKKKTEQKKFLFKILTVVFACMFLIASGLMIYEYVQEKEQQQFGNVSESTENSNQGTDAEENIEQNTEQNTESVDELAQLGIEVPEKNIDWAGLQAQNDDVYAWIYIPGTKVDYPVLQHPEELSFYWRRGMDGNYLTAGCINTEKINSKDFTDPHTVMYGHNMRNETMFATLHNYESLEFFETHPYIYVYMPDKVLVYEVFAAYLRDDAHLLFSYNCNNPNSFQGYLDSIFEVRDMEAHFREDTELTSEDHILTLSTCERGEDYMRYLVQGVLLNPSALEQTN